MPQNGDMMQAARVIGCSTDGEGNPIGQYDPNLMLNTRVYDVMFPNGGAIQQSSANLLLKVCMRIQMKMDLDTNIWIRS